MDNLNTISYADDWKDAYTPIYKEKEAEIVENVEVKKERIYGKPILLIVQLVLCLLVLLAGFCIKTFGGDLYEIVHNWYYDNLNDEIIMTGNFESFDLDKILNNEI